MRRTACILVLAVLAAGAAGADAVQARGSLFGKQETRVEGLGPFPQWRRVLERYPADLEAGLDCQSGLFSSCEVKEWRAFLEEIRDADRRTQLARVNDFLNEYEYVEDIVNWGQEEYWATPPEFVLDDGDCEDYAIAKYISLKELGWSVENLRVVLVLDFSTGEGHAVLAVYLPEAIFILDNQVDHVVHNQNVRHYLPIYSLNEHGYWKHR